MRMPVSWYVVKADAEASLLIGVKPPLATRASIATKTGYQYSFNAN